MKIPVPLFSSPAKGGGRLVLMAMVVSRIAIFMIQLISLISNFTLTQLIYNMYDDAIMAINIRL